MCYQDAALRSLPDSRNCRRVLSLPTIAHFNSSLGRRGKFPPSPLQFHACQGPNSRADSSSLDLTLVVSYCSVSGSWQGPRCPAILPKGVPATSIHLTQLISPLSIRSGHSSRASLPKLEFLLFWSRLSRWRGRWWNLTQGWRSLRRS